MADMSGKRLGKLLVFIVALHGFSQNPDLPKSAGLKLYRSKHLHIYFTVELQSHVQGLAEQADLFLDQIEKKWSIILPKDKINVSLARHGFYKPAWPHFRGPLWLQSRFDPLHQRIDIRVTRPRKFELKPTAAALKHQLVHYLLNWRPYDRMPTYLEEGLARYYGNPAARGDHFLVILGLWRTKNLKAYLTRQETFAKRKEFDYGAALSGEFIAWLWQKNPKGERRFLQSILSGNSVNQAFAVAGVHNVDNLLSEFEPEVRNGNRLHGILFTRDLWLILLGSTALIAMGVKLARAFLSSRRPFSVVETPVSPVEPSLFRGPAFGGGAAQPVSRPRPIPPPRALARAPRRVATKNQGSLEESLDQAFDGLLTATNARPNDSDGKPCPAPPANASPTTKETIEADPFNGLGEDMEDDLNRIFGDWDGGIRQGEREESTRPRRPKPKG